MIRATATALVGLPAGIVDAWCVPLGDERLIPASWALSLSADERAERNRRGALGLSWAIARGALRVILALYLDVEATSLRFERGPVGKPHLAGRSSPHFNVSWRESLALIVVAADREVGVDLEAERDDTDIDAIARDHLSPLEAEALRRTAPERRRAEFFAAWTRHEARRKLHGLGLADPLPMLAEGALVIVRSLDVPAGYAAAVAAEGSAWRLRARDIAEVS